MPRYVTNLEMNDFREFLSKMQKMMKVLENVSYMVSVQAHKLKKKVSEKKCIQGVI
jgi:hypothetical protein